MAVFYLVLSLVAFFWHGATQETNDLWRLDRDQSLLTLAWTPLVGVAFGLAVVQGFRLLEPRMAWIPELQREFREIFGRPELGELLLLAAASAVGEELLFRGAMLDAWGPWISTLVFGLLHVPPKRSMWPWTASSLVLGLCLAGLTLLTGNLGAAVAAHFVINFLNMMHITRQSPTAVVRPTARPGAPA